MAVKKKVKAVEEEVPVRKNKKVVEPKVKGNVVKYGTIPGLDITETLDAIEKKVGFSASSMGNEGRMSTGLLGLDIVLGGGVTAGWYTHFGKEQCCKTTGAIAILASAVKQGVPIIAFSDFEGSTSSSLDYLENIFKTTGLDIGIDALFGVKNRSGKYVIPPMVRMQNTSVAEDFFDYLAQLERILPDKIMVGDDWWCVYENTKENQKKLTAAKLSYDKTLYQKTGNLYVPAEDGSLQALLITDSYPAMLPSKLDVEDAKSGLGAVARMFAEQIPRVKGKMKKKRIAVIGINQLRDKPMVMFGSPEYEPCGNAVRFASDARLKFSSRAISSVAKDGYDAKQAKGNQEEEDSVEFDGGTDTYRYIHVRGEKNKLSTPYLETYLRLWITDGESKPKGFDPVFDTFAYLKNTGQLEGKRSAMYLKIKGKEEAKKALKWEHFKMLILPGNRDKKIKIFNHIGLKPVNIRALCFKQIQSGTGIDMYFEHVNIQKKAKKERGEQNDDGASEV